MLIIYSSIYPYLCSLCNLNVPSLFLLHIMLGNAILDFSNLFKISSRISYITIINRVSIKLLLCLTLYLYLIAIFFLLILSMTSKSLCNFYTCFTYFSGATIFLRAIRITLNFTLLYTFTRLMNMAYGSYPHFYLLYNI